MEKIFDVLILGAGASGLMCAGELRQKSGLRIGVIEGNQQPAQKLKISGGGKCNITNRYVTSEHFLGEELFVKEVLKCFGKEDLLAFLHVNHVELELRKGRYYFCKKSSNEIISLLLKRCRDVAFFYAHHIHAVTCKDNYYNIQTDKGYFKTKQLVVATGGESFKNIGATDIGLKIAADFGIGITPFTPALVGMTLQKEQFWMKELSGTSCKVKIDINSKTIEEEMLFAHKGISGPVVLSASLYWKKGTICIDFLPEDDLDTMIKNSKKNLSTAIPLPKRFMKLFLAHINLEDKACHRLSQDERKKLTLLKHYCFAPAGNFGFSKAEVSRGGVKSDDLHVNSLMSREHKGLYFIGEVVDVTGELGGYNFQWAFSSAVVASTAILSNN